MAYDANYPADNLFVYQVPEAIRSKGADLKEMVDAANEQIDAGMIVVNDLQNQVNILTESSKNIRTIRRLYTPPNINGKRKYSYASAVPNGTTSVPLCCIDIFGMGYQVQNFQPTCSSRFKITLACWDELFTMECIAYRRGSSIRVDFQSYLRGGTDANNYMALSRGAMTPPNGLFTGKPGYEEIKNVPTSGTGLTTNSTSLAQHAHRMVVEGSDYGYTGPADANVNVGWSGEHSHSISGAHGHTYSVIYKVNGDPMGTGASHKSFVDSGSFADGSIGLKLYVTNSPTSTGTELTTNYTVATGSYIKIVLDNIHHPSSWATIVTSTVEFDDCNHSIWYYDPKFSGWEVQPRVGVTGASDVRGSDLDDFFAGQGYEYIWSEKRGYWNYGVDGSNTYDLYDTTPGYTDSSYHRVKVEGGKLYLRETTSSTWNSGFTHVILGVGAGDCASTILARTGETGRSDYDRIRAWALDPATNPTLADEVENSLKDIRALVAKVKESDTIPVLLLFSQIKDIEALQATGQYLAKSNIDGSNEREWTDTEWNAMIEFWNALSDAIFQWAMEQNIRVIDLWQVSEYHSMSGIPGSFLGKWGHYNILGQMITANYADAVYRP